MTTRSRHFKGLVSLVLAAVFGLNACTVGSDYKPDKMDLPSRFTETPPPGDASGHRRQ